MQEEHNYKSLNAR